MPKKNRRGWKNLFQLFAAMRTESRVWRYSLTTLWTESTWRRPILLLWLRILLLWRCIAFVFDYFRPGEVVEYSCGPAEDYKKDKYNKVVLSGFNLCQFNSQLDYFKRFKFKLLQTS